MNYLLFLAPPLVLLFLCFIYDIYATSFGESKNIPGPFWARFSRLWILKALSGGVFEKENIALHRKYAPPGEKMAPFVRVGPNMYSLATPEKIVYGIGSSMPKSDFYSTFQHPGVENVFSMRNMQAHAQKRRRFSTVYSLSSLLQYQSYVDETIERYKIRLLEFSRSGKPIDLAVWMQYYAFDVIGAITYGKRFGFLDEGRDMGGLIESMDKSLPMSTVIGIYPSLYIPVFRVLQYLPGSAMAGVAYMLTVIGGHLKKRTDQRAVWEKEGKGIEADEGAPMDMLDKMLNAMENTGRPVGMGDDAWVMIAQNIAAGSDTTAISLSSCMYNLLKTPEALIALRHELDGAVRDGLLTEKGISFKHTQELPYLQACIKEALRIHPATGLPMWRVVPKGGATICGQRFSEGAIIGTNSWVAHRNQGIWGEDADVFRPERWIEADTETKKIMETNWMPFGQGSRTCLGRHISYLEMCKLLPVIVREFDFDLQNAGKTWSTQNWWFVKPKDFMVVVKARIPADNETKKF